MEYTQELQSKEKTILQYFTEERIVIPTLVSLLFLFSFLLYKNITRKVRESENPPVGVLTFKTNRVERKFDGEVVWESIPTQTIIRNRDTIRTEKLSDAVLTLEDGTQIEIGENSMIIVDFSDKKYNLNFAYGTVGAKKGTGESDIVIKAGDTAVSMESGELSLSKVGAKLDVNVTEGQAKLLKGQEARELEKNQTATIDKDSVKIQTQWIELTSPEDRSILIADKEPYPMNFSWKILNPSVRNLRLVVSRDLRFRKLEINASLSETKFSASLRPGVYYWKIQYSDPENKATETTVHRFTIFKNQSLRIFTPEPGSRLGIPEDSLKPILFSWSQLESISRYKLEIANNPQLENPIQVKETKSNSIGVLGLGEGEYYFRITAISAIPEIKDVESEVGNFSLVTESSNEPPKLIEPKEGKVISLLQIQEKGLLFSWKDAPGAREYQIQISPNNNMNPIEWEEKTNQNFIRWNPEGRLGQFYWRVASVNKAGKEMYSNVQSFTLEQNLELVPLKPSKNASLEYQDGGKVVFAWKPIPSGIPVKLLISKDSNFQNLVYEELGKGSGITLNLPEQGEYYWKLVWEGANTKVESEVYSFTLKLPIAAPEILYPMNGQQIDMTNSNELPFRWSEVKDADSYQLRLLDITGLKEREIWNATTTTNMVRLQDLSKLNQGKFRLEVRAIKTIRQPNKAPETLESKVVRSDFYITIQTGKITRILTPEKIYVE